MGTRTWSLPAVAFALVLGPPARAQYTWTNSVASNDWNQAQNWSPINVPNSPTATTTLDDGGLSFGGTVTVNTSVQAQSITFNNTSGNYTIGSAAGQTISGMAAISVGSGVTTTQAINLANVAAGSLIFSSLTITNDAALGTNPTLVIGPDTVIGTSGGGSVAVTGSGFTRISGTFAGGGSSVISTLNKSGSGQLDLSFPAGSGNNIGTLNIAAGTVTLGGGSLALTDSYSTHVNVGGGSATALTIRGGATLDGANSIDTSRIDGAGAVVTGAGSKWLDDSLTVGDVGNGSLTVQSGGTVGIYAVVVAATAASTGSLTVNGTGSQILGPSRIIVGANGGGFALVQGGGAVTTYTTEIAQNPSSIGSVTVTGFGSKWACSGYLYVGGNANLISPGGTATLSVSNGGAVTVGQLFLMRSDVSITVNGGTLSAASLANPGGVTPTLYLSDPAGGMALTVGTDNSSSTYSAPIADAAGGPGTVNKVGTGTWTLTSQLTNTGGYTAANGTIEFSGAVVRPGPGSLTAAAVATIQYDAGARVIDGILRGPGMHVVTGGSTFTGGTSASDAIINVIGPASFVSFTNGGAITINAGGSDPTNLNMVTNDGSGSITVAGGRKIYASDFQTYGTLTLIPGLKTIPTLVANTGSSPLYFNGGSQTLISVPANAGRFDAGIDLHGQNAVVAAGLFVNNGFVEDTTNANPPATVIADFGSLVKGAGFFQNSVQTVNGGKFQSGNSPGQASFGSFVFGPGGVRNYVFAIDDATGTAGPNPDANGQVSGWGLVKTVQRLVGGTTTTGDFAWTATPANQLTVSLDTLVNPTTVGTDVAGPMADFDPTKPYSWPAASWAGKYTGPTDSTALNASTAFDTTGFVNPIEGTFGWSLDAGGHSLSLTYTPSAVPEPGTLTLADLAGLALAWARRRRHR